MPPIPDNPFLWSHQTTCCFLNGLCFFHTFASLVHLGSISYLSKHSPGVSFCVKPYLVPQIELARLPWPHLSICRVPGALKSSVGSLVISSYKPWSPWGQGPLYPSLPWHWVANQLSATHVPSTILGAEIWQREDRPLPSRSLHSYEGSRQTSNTRQGDDFQARYVL